MLRPLARLLLRNGVAYPAFPVAMKKVFWTLHTPNYGHWQKAHRQRVSLMSGVHRRDCATWVAWPSPPLPMPKPR